MGIESDQLVYDYLSKVGDIAQQRALSSAQRMRLVTELRANIDRVRAAEDAQTADQVKRILKRFGTPGSVVDSVAEDPGRGAPEVAPEPQTAGRGFSVRSVKLPKVPKVPRPRRSDPEPSAAPRSTAASPPHLAGEDELDQSGAGPDWWRVEPGPLDTMPGQSVGDTVPGFTGGIEVPEILRPPPKQEDEPVKLQKQRAAEEEAEEEYEEEEAEDDADEEYGRARPVLHILRSVGPLELVAILCLLAGTVTGVWLVLVIGWLLVYGSRRLSRTEVKIVVFGVPGTVAVGLLVWLWGRADGRWGEPLAEDAFNAALTDALPWAVRVAAVASAALLFWRARRDQLR
ncbi:hypothetical protein G5C51_13170 [Streptomyces sp. A7024]|uniref:Uncharacterized protein n=1 Tax=Streptomyces coryli TaxID=1128680 RepID=A0A6G4TYK0_9ACTN|nr:hypothetical protein [Streptomyces coryli]